MSELNTMLREHARTGLQAALDTAVTNGDTEAARKASADLTKLELQLAPKAPAYGDPEIKAQLDTKATWFGVDPKRTAKAMEFGKTMNPAKFASAELFADAIIKAVDEEFPAAGGRAAPKEGDEEDGEDEDENEPGTKKPAARRATDAPGAADANASTGNGRKAAGPWSKISDAPKEVQEDIKRTADKFVPANAPKEQREKYVANALASHYAAHQRTKGKK
jgi:hypothetical protein